MRQKDEGKGREKMKINKLTPEQEEMKAMVRDRWIARGISTGLCNRPAAEDCIKRAYVAAKTRQVASDGIAYMVGGDGARRVLK